MNETAIRTEGLCRDYGDLRALDDVNLSIDKGRVVAMLGPNGAGKTTFLHILMGMLEPTGGRAEVLGANSRALPKDVVGRIGYMGDGDEPPRWATAGQLIGLQAGASYKLARGFAEQLLAKRGLSRKSVYGALSKGQKKWVRAALVLAAKPEVMLLDEPAEGLDPSARRELYDELRDYVTDSDATVVVATHIIADIERIADEAAIIDKGRVATHAALDDLREQVREIELTENDAIPESADGIEVLGSKAVSGAVLVWVRCSQHGQRKLETICPKKAVIRAVGLETFYLAMTEHNGKTESTDGQAQERHNDI
ncbi:MAG TPA: ABC transporter ATP-binding protein [Sedimentisphaerales bacterium]|nr:ABC transporter ATP-binding protein [Sedimentisphaerales bacterium]